MIELPLFDPMTIMIPDKNIDVSHLESANHFFSTNESGLLEEIVRLLGGCDFTYSTPQVKNRLQACINRYEKLYKPLGLNLYE